MVFRAPRISPILLALLLLAACGTGSGSPSSGAGSPLPSVVALEPDADPRRHELSRHPDR